MKPTQMLVRYGPEPGGWTWSETDPGVGPRIAALHNVPNLTRTEALKETADLLAHLGADTAYRVGIDPSGTGDVPGTDYWLGDAVTVDGSDELRVGAFTIGLDRQIPGRVVQVPEIGQVVDPVTVRQANINKRMSNGTVGGRSPVAVPLGQTRGQSVGDSPEAGGCCTAGWQGLANGSLASASFVTIEVEAPVSSMPGWVFPATMSATTVDGGMWSVDGYALIEWTGAAAGGEVTIAGTGPDGGVILGGEIVPAGVDRSYVELSGLALVNPGSSWAPQATVTSTVATAADVTLVMHLHGSCGCLHTVTTGGG